MTRKKSRVAITHNKDIGRAIEEALGHFDRDLKGLFRGKIVAVQNLHQSRLRQGD